MKAADKEVDAYGREVTTKTHYSCCLLYAVGILLTRRGKLRMQINGYVPHFYAESEGYRHEFVYGFNRHTNNIWFRGYGIRTESKQPKEEE